ncbi:MAG TPA: hypothetical protein VGO62_02340 [Myxococcota bacterium]
MARHTTLALVVTGLVLVAGCPERKELINTVGGAPKAEVDQVHAHVSAEEKQIQKNTDAAAAIHD